MPTIKFTSYNPEDTTYYPEGHKLEGTPVATVTVDVDGLTVKRRVGDGVTDIDAYIQDFAKGLAIEFQEKEVPTQTSLKSGDILVDE